MDLLFTLGQSIKKYRQMRGMSQRDVAAATGIVAHHLSSIENGKINVSVDSLQKICNAIGCKLQITVSPSVGAMPQAAPVAKQPAAVAPAKRARKKVS